MLHYTPCFKPRGQERQRKRRFSRFVLSVYDAIAKLTNKLATGLLLRTQVILFSAGDLWIECTWVVAKNTEKIYPIEGSLIGYKIMLNKNNDEYAIQCTSLVKFEENSLLLIKNLLFSLIVTIFLKSSSWENLANIKNKSSIE